MRLVCIGLILILALAGQAPASPGKLFMWKATGKPGVVYLLGSMHLASPKLYPLPVEMEQAFNSSTCLVVEADDGKLDQGAMMQLTLQYGICTQGDSLASHLSPSTKAALDKYLESQGAGAPPVQAMRPWLAAATITGVELEKHGLDPDQGIDKHFLKEAHSAGRKIDELESAEFQMKLMAGFPDKLQDAFLAVTFDEVSHLNDEFDHMLSAWRAGDIPGMTHICFDDDNKNPDMAAFDTELIDKRNIGMESRIESYLSQPGSTFVVVGAAHLIGDNGIISILQHKGYAVEQVSHN